jgi:hypothetical protein
LFERSEQRKKMRELLENENERGGKDYEVRF